MQTQIHMTTDTSKLTKQRKGRSFIREKEISDFKIITDGKKKYLCSNLVVQSKDN